MKTPESENVYAISPNSPPVIDRIKTFYNITRLIDETGSFIDQKASKIVLGDIMDVEGTIAGVRRLSFLGMLLNLSMMRHRVPRALRNGSCYGAIPTATGRSAVAGCTNTILQGFSVSCKSRAVASGLLLACSVHDQLVCRGV